MCTSIDVYVFFVILYISPSSLLPTDDEASVDKLKLKQAFDKLLYELVDLNQERLNAINRVFQLEDRPVTSGLRSSVEERDEEPLVLLIVNPKKTNNEDNDDNRGVYIPYPLYAYLRSRGQSGTSRSLSIPTPDADTDGNGVKAAERMAILRGWSDCRKSAVKACTKACNSASKNVCADYKCSSRMKKSFKKECKAECNHRFE